MPPTGGVIVLQVGDETSVGLVGRRQKPITSRAREKHNARLGPRAAIMKSDRVVPMLFALRQFCDALQRNMQMERTAADKRLAQPARFAQWVRFTFSCPAPLLNL
jgi:hypothetical protein